MKIAKGPASSAMLLIDVINDFNFMNSRKLLRYAIPAAKKIAALKRRLQKQGIPMIYVNDNFGQWQSNFDDQVKRCLDPTCDGSAISALLVPSTDDYFVLKPKHSGFYSTSLDVLLDFLQIDTLIMTGFAADICVLYTANDAYMRDFNLIIPSDCVASETVKGNRQALDHMKTRLKARVCKSPSV